MVKAYLIGTGPSLDNVDLFSLKGGLTYAMNRIHTHRDWAAGWRPDFYLNTDRSRNPYWKEDIAYFLEDGEERGYPVITRKDMLDPNDVLDGNPPLKKKAGEYLCLIQLDRCGHFNIRTRPSKKWHSDNTICTFGSPLFVAAQMAVLVKECDELVLLGCDLGYKYSRKKGAVDTNHFGTEYLPSDAFGDGKWSEIRNNTLLHGHKILAEEAKNRGFKVFNATEGGQLEIHARKSLGELL